VAAYAHRLSRKLSEQHVQVAHSAKKVSHFSHSSITHHTENIHVLECINCMMPAQVQITAQQKENGEINSAAEKSD